MIMFAKHNNFGVHYARKIAHSVDADCIAEKPPEVWFVCLLEF